MIRIEYDIKIFYYIAFFVVVFNLLFIYKPYIMAIFSLTVALFLLIVIYMLIKELLSRDDRYKNELEEEVKIRTKYFNELDELENYSKNQDYLLSMFKTVADCNKILIVTKNIDKLIEDVARTIHSNASFACVKISILQDGKLNVKSSIGFNEEMKVSVFEKDVFAHNQKLFLKRSDGSMPIEYLHKVRVYNVTQVYILPLRKEHHAKRAFGVMSICSTKENGFSMQEVDIINELASEIGFVINSLQ